ncbi:unnamed protein product [Rotaria sp. Silwood2]|nr:unnamed protein product [Rotaria sp. Silwood2]
MDEIMPYRSTTIATVIANAIVIIQCLESARQAGDFYPTQEAMFASGIGNTTHVAYGEIMGYASTNVPAYSNENDTYVSYESHYLYGVYMGMKWQCVEYARRWLFIRKGCVFKSIVGAADIWTEVDSVQRVIDGKCFPLKKHPNGSPLPPKNESLLIYTRSGIDMLYGHVAMIVDILPDFIRVAEENYDFSYWSRNYSREIPYRMINGSYYVEDEYPVFGWMTVEDNNQAKPLDEATINILIKLNGSLFDLDLSIEMI